MAKVFYVSPGRSYTVTATEGTTITYPGITIPAATVGASGSVTFNCTGTEITVSDDSAQIVQNFNNAGAAVAGAGEGSGGASLEGVALLEGGNSFSGDQNIEGDVVIEGSVTISGDVTAEGEYNGAEVIETSNTTITPEAGKYYKYTGTGDAITVAAPIWNGYMTISYLETTTPVDLQGVTWSPAKPSLAGAGPFVYTLVHAGSGSVLASAMNYSVATAEAIQKVVPIAWENNSAVFGINAKSKKNYSVALGYGADSQSNLSITIGSKLYSGNSTFNCLTEAPQSITIGAGANTLNNGDTESSNSVTIGCKASNQGADSVVIGAQAHNAGGQGAVVIGAGKKNEGHSFATVLNGYVSNYGGTSIGAFSSSSYCSIAAGYSANAGGQHSVAVGRDAGTAVIAPNSTAIGYTAKAADASVVVFASLATDNTKTQLYFSGANTPLANTYENGEAMMGYVVMQKGADGQFAPVAAGTQKLSVLFPNNSTFQPATIDENGEWVMPKVFHPSDLDLPNEEPTAPESVEINIPEPTLPEPEPEEYTPLPVYPIVEPEIPLEP